MTDDIEDDEEPQVIPGEFTDEVQPCPILVPWADYMNPDLPVPGVEIEGGFGYRYCSDAEYHAFPAVSNSLLKCKTADEMYCRLTRPGKSTDALALGVLLDLAVLTPEATWRDRYRTFKAPTDKKGKPYKGGMKYAAAKQAVQTVWPSKMIVTMEQLEADIAEVRALYRAVLADAECSDELDKAKNPQWRQATGFYFHEDWGIWLKWRIDILPQYKHKDYGRRIIDLKSTAAHLDDFFKEALKFRYFQQAVWYSFCDYLLLRKKFRDNAPMCSSFDFLVVSKATPERGCAAQMMGFPLDPDLNALVKSNQDTLGITPGGPIGRVDVFRRSLLEQVAVNPDPGDFLAVRRCWPAREEYTAQKGRRLLMIDPRKELR